MRINDQPMASEEQRGFRAIPPVNVVLAELASLDIAIEPGIATAVVTASLDESRRRIAVGASLTRADVIQAVRDRVAELSRPRLARVLNGTGIVIHTNLGRAPVSGATAAAMATVAASAVALEIEPETNARGGRMREIAGLLRVLIGSEAVLVVNNNAAAVLLVLAALTSGREVIVSRGEAVEIGGGFRIPDVMRQSGARLVEVGTTNRTYARDYERAITAETAAILKVHPSNFRMSGFTATPAVDELAALGAVRGIPLIEDLGSGAIVDTARFGLDHEPTMRESLEAGASIILASGDKLLGGPQAGIIAGNAELVAQIAAHPLARAVRADKTCLAGVATTLRHHVRGEVEQYIPIWRMIAAQPDDLAHRADAIIAAIGGDKLTLDKGDIMSSVGGGALPGQELPSVGIRLTSPEGDQTPDAVAHCLRTHQPIALFARIQHGTVVIDLRTILPEDDDALINILRCVSR